MASSKGKNKAKVSTKTETNNVHKPVAAVKRALSILSAFRNAKNPLWLHEISEHTGLYKSTALRLLETMQEDGYIFRMSDGRYQLGALVFELGAAYQASFQLEHLVQPVLEKLSKLTNESATFYLRSGNMRQCMWRVESPQAVRDILLKGQMLEMGKSSDSQVFIEFEKKQGELAASNWVNLIRYSSREDADPTASISSPVFDHNGFVGVLTISGPAERFTKDNVKKMTSELIQEVEALSDSLGHKN